ncbi:MAG: hypothetical protein H8E36_05995 [Rhodospirillaceae bacterium]|nr:hypothetical protein [Rhodospirillaceae bacterium]MBL6930340.1 hypothetical protein [Rhodospirillales bacterium]
MFINNRFFGALVFAGLLLTSNAAGAHHANCADLHAAAFLDEPDELAGLLEHGTDLNCLDGLRQTPLITATDGASLDIIKMLLRLGVSINERDEIGQTALTKARQKLAFFDMDGGQKYRAIYREIIDRLEQAGARE